MGPIQFTPEIWPPIERADEPARGELAMAGDKHRAIAKLTQRRRQREKSDPDADQFTPAQNREAEEASST